MHSHTSLDCPDALLVSKHVQMTMLLHTCDAPVNVCAASMQAVHHQCPRKRTLLALNSAAGFVSPHRLHALAATAAAADPRSASWSSSDFVIV